MQSTQNNLTTTWLKLTLVVLLTTLVTQTIQAHLMVAQNGTLNIIDSDAFVVISLPISAFKGIDSNQDGDISMIEFNQNRNAVTQTIQNNFKLVDKENSITLEDILLSPVQAHHSTTDHFTQLTVMGKFSLKNISNSIELQVDLFGKSTNEQALKVTITRAKDKLKQVVKLTPESPSAQLLLTRI